MKYKILLCGRDPELVNDFFLRQDFSCMTCSDIWEDVTAHFDIFKPDACVFFFDRAEDSVISRLKAVYAKTEYRGVKLVAVGDGEVCALISRRAITVPLLKIKQPTTYHLMERQISSFIENKTEGGTPSGTAAVKPAAGTAVGAAAKDTSSVLDGLGLGISLDDLKKSFAEESAKKRILVVDDDRSVLKMLKNALSEKYDITTMVNGKMAEKYLETKTADLILLDYEMPEESGAEVFRRLRLKLKAMKIPVIFLTGVADSEKIKEVLALKPQGYLLKPINMERLLASIKKAIG